MNTEMIKSLNLKGYCDAEIARQIGTSRQYVSRQRAMMKLEPGKKGNRDSQSRKKRAKPNTNDLVAINAYNPSLTVAQMAKNASMSYNQFRHYISYAKKRGWLTHTSNGE